MIGSLIPGSCKRICFATLNIFVTVQLTSSVQFISGKCRRVIQQLNPELPKETFFKVQQVFEE
jgi:hypothetical protein